MYESRYGLKINNNILPLAISFSNDSRYCFVKLKLFCLLDCNSLISLTSANVSSTYVLLHFVEKCISVNSL